MCALYLHIPFCRRKCGYCDFYSSVDLDHIDRFVEALFLEMARYSGPITDSLYQSLYLGGGSPSLLQSRQICQIIHEVKKRFRFSSQPEWSIEVNPGTVDSEKLNTYIDLGFNRLSIGAQSFRQQELDLLERIHCPGDIKKTVQMARSAGFQNIGVDLIFGLPEQTLRDWKISLNVCLDLEPEHISAYALTWSENTPLGRLILQGAVSAPDDERVSDQFLKTHDCLCEHGYVHYEISNYAKSGYECRHNWQYWKGTPYLGLGPSAHSFWKRQRWWNIADVDQYCDRLENGASPIDSRELLSEQELKREKIALGLRTILGIPINDFIQKDYLKILSAEGLAEFQENRWKLTPRGMLLADEIAVKLV